MITIKRGEIERINRMVILAYRLADDSSASLLECSLNHVQGWLDTQTCEACDDHAIREAMEYLELRGLLERHPEHPHLVRFIEQEGEPA